MIAGLAALVIAAVYTGAAAYVKVVELPVLLALDDPAMLTGWKFALKRGFLMQAPFCVLGFLLGAWAWWQTRAIGDAIGALAMLANIPWTLAVIAPINTALQKLAPNASGGEARALIRRLGSLHAVRTALGVVGVIAFFLGVAN